MALRNGLRLYVVNEESSDPKDWLNCIGWRKIVVAHTAEEALSVSGEKNVTAVTEIVLKEPMVLFHDESGYPDE